METRGQIASESRVESIFSGNIHSISLGGGIHLREFANAGCGAVGMSTGIVEFAQDAVLNYHFHPISEAIVVLAGTARISVEGRQYLLAPFDCIHVPADTVHEVSNPSESSALVAFSAFASSNPKRQFVKQQFDIEFRGTENPTDIDPEYIVRFEEKTRFYELSKGAKFIDLFAGRFGAVGICGGYGRFEPGASLPCHFHEYDESISIVDGEAICLVHGKKYAPLANCDTAVIPRGRPHRFINDSNSSMAMIWVYAGSEPERSVVDPGHCSGSLVWPSL